MPLPQEMHICKGEFEINEATVIYVDANNEELLQVGLYLSKTLKPATGFALDVRPVIGNMDMSGLILLTKANADLTLGQEGYELFVEPERVTVRGIGEAGIFYGIQTIRQLLPVEIESQNKISDTAWLMPCVKIIDHPEFPWRGFMLDSCRHFQDKDFIKRYIDLLSYHKMNIFHWHLTEDDGWRIQIDKYPNLTEIGSVRIDEDGTNHKFFYAKDEIKEIVAYAKSRYITVVPEFDIPGHITAALVACPDYSCTGGPFKPAGKGFRGFINENGRLALCAGNDKAIQFAKDVVDEIFEIFDTPYLHIGGDERPKGNWDKCDKCRAKIKELGLASEDQLQNWLLDTINAHILTHKRRSIAWAENMEDGIPENQITHAWHAGETEFAVQKKNSLVINSTNGYCYLDYPATIEQKPAFPGWMPVMTIEKMYGYDIIPKGFSSDQAKMVIGIEAPLWTENVPQDRVDFMVFPRLLSTIETNWLPKSKRKFPDFKKRAYYHLKRLNLLGVTYDPDVLK